MGGHFSPGSTTPDKSLKALTSKPSISTGVHNISNFTLYYFPYNSKQFLHLTPKYYSSNPAPRVSPTTISNPKSYQKTLNLTTFPTNAPCKFNILGHESDSFCMNCTEVCIFKQCN